MDTNQHLEQAAERAYMAGLELKASRLTFERSFVKAAIQDAGTIKAAAQFLGFSASGMDNVARRLGLRESRKRTKDSCCICHEKRFPGLRTCAWHLVNARIKERIRGAHRPGKLSTRRPLVAEEGFSVDANTRKEFNRRALEKLQNRRVKQ